MKYFLLGIGVGILTSATIVIPFFRRYIELSLINHLWEVRRWHWEDKPVWHHRAAKILRVAPELYRVEDDLLYVDVASYLVVKKGENKS